MSRLESAKRLMRRWFTSIPFFVVLGLGLGVEAGGFILQHAVQPGNGEEEEEESKEEG